MNSAACPVNAGICEIAEAQEITTP